MADDMEGARPGRPWGGGTPPLLRFEPDGAGEWRMIWRAPVPGALSAAGRRPSSARRVWFESLHRPQQHVLLAAERKLHHAPRLQGLAGDQRLFVAERRVVDPKPAPADLAARLA